MKLIIKVTLADLHQTLPDFYSKHVLEFDYDKLDMNMKKYVSNNDRVETLNIEDSLNWGNLQEILDLGKKNLWRRF